MSPEVKHVDMDPEACPHCGEVQNAAAEMKGSTRKPKADDLTLCFDCGEWSVFDADLKRRACNDEELDYIGTSQECRDLRKSWVKFMREEERDER